MSDHTESTPTNKKEAIITVVGFLGAGKTTLIKTLITRYHQINWNPYVILNDYENANLDAQQLTQQMEPEWIKALSGSCICCSGIGELREFVNNIPARENGITLIEANGTSDACSLMGFLGVGVHERFMPPIQISVVDVKLWQTRGEHNELEANQIQVSSLLLLTHLEKASETRKTEVIKELKKLNPSAKILTMEDLDVKTLPYVLPSNNPIQKLDHYKAHWSSCSADLPALPDLHCVKEICKEIPSSILRVKGCTKIAEEENFSYFERNPDGEVFIRPYNGVPITGPKLLTIGPGSDSSELEKIIQKSLVKGVSRKRLKEEQS